MSTKKKNPMARDLADNKYRQRVVRQQRVDDWKKELDSFFKNEYNEE